jgi:hypothetical protein
MSTDFQHSAYLAARHAIRSAQSVAVKSLRQSCPHADSESCFPAIAQAMTLCITAQRLASQTQQSRDLARLAAELARKCPGYSDATCELAAHHAFADFIR